MSDKEDGLAVNVAEGEEAARWLLKAGEQLVHRLCDYHHHRHHHHCVIIITIAITLEDLREKEGACGGSTSATILQGACPAAGSFQFDHDVEIYKDLHLCCIDILFLNRRKICLINGFRPTFTGIGCFSDFSSELQDSYDNDL